MSIEDQPTQQIRRTASPAPMPGSLNPVRDQSGAADTPENGSTEVLSLDDLMSGPRTAPTQTTPTPPAAPRIGAVPVGAEQQSTGSAGRALGDAATAWRSGLNRSRAWLTAGDNIVVIATAVVALLLLLAVAMF